MRVLCSRLIQEGTMPEYRAYIIGSDGYFLDVVELICDDEAAIKKAATLVDRHNIELWQLDRQIIKCNHEEKSQS